MEDPHTREHLEQFFKNNIYKEIPDNNWKQAMVPEGALILDNHNGMAPGLILEKRREDSYPPSGTAGRAVSYV